MKGLFIALFALLTGFVNYASTSNVDEVGIQSTFEELTLNGRYCTGKGGYWGEWITLYLNSNKVKTNEEVLIQLDLDGADLTQWEFNPLRGNGTVYVNDLNLDSGIIRFTPLSGNVVTFDYTLERGGSVKIGSCSFVVR